MTCPPRSSSLRSKWWSPCTVDGNERAGLLAAQVFLDVNGVPLEHDSEAFYALTMGVAEGRIDKPAVAAELERIAKSQPTT